ncbi:MAG TPA: dihydrofolate reductase family protein [Chitinophagaceae bacterium]|nr:dihydrofolate reductase family protein [Chitinophagaceae bacterium]
MKITAFEFLSVDGFFEGLNHDISWNIHGPEEEQYSIQILEKDNILLFGRRTYTLMQDYWTSPDAIQNDPRIIRGMNNAEKVVFSRSLKQVDWIGTTLVHENPADWAKKMKQGGGKDLTILGSGSILSQLTDHGLIDEYQFQINPIALGEGTPIFRGIQKRVKLELIQSRVFKSGIVLVCYKPRTGMPDSKG